MTENIIPDFNLADGHEYLLDRSYAAASRLNFQFYLWKESLHFNIHPSIPIPDDKAQIADVATGTAIWILDTARELPTAQFDGLDISLSQAPAKEWLPSNIQLRAWDIFDNVPNDLLAKYDIIHVRLLVLVVRKSDPRPLLRKFAKMLKPGGYLQWDELNYPDTSVKIANPSIQTPALDELRELVYSRGRNDWTVQLAEIMKEEGFDGATLYHFEDPIALVKANSEQHLLTMEEFAFRLDKINKRTEAMKLYKLIERVHQESLQGAALSKPRVVCVAKRGLEIV